MSSLLGRRLALVASLVALAVISCACAGSNGRRTASGDTQQNKPSIGNTSSASPVPAPAWNRASAAAYLNGRETWWMQWHDAKRDSDTFCISCHTNLPFVFARPALRGLPIDGKTTENEQKLIDDVKKRVRRWSSLDSYYGDKEDPEGNGPGSRGTEAVLNAVILAYCDSETGELSDDARLAFKNMWALQQTSGSLEGAWQWQKFRLSPWESNDSPYFGATVAALAVGIAPGNYRSDPEIQSNLASLRSYLHREYPEQSLLNRVGLLWASSKMDGLLTEEQRKLLLKEIREKQQTDGGWSLSALTWSSHYLGIPSLLTTRRRNDWTQQETVSDGFATGYIAFVLQQAGVSREDPVVQRAVRWLIANQDQTNGYWTAYSLNRKRDHSTDVGQFMNDAATAFAVLALSSQGS